MDNDRVQAAEVERELDEMRDFLLDEQKFDTARFLAVLQASCVCNRHITPYSPSFEP